MGSVKCVAAKVKNADYEDLLIIRTNLKDWSQGAKGCFSNDLWIISRYFGVYLSSKMQRIANDQHIIVGKISMKL